MMVSEFIQYESNVGVIRVVMEDGLIAHVRIGDSVKQFRAWCDEAFGHGVSLKERSHQRLTKAFDRYFSGNNEPFDFPVKLIGTDFEVKVWRAIADIAQGRTKSYAELASRIGRPLAYRAVGSACGKNPVPIIIPCHRVLTSDNKIGGYSAAGGVKTKRALLDLEGVHLGR